MFVMHVALGGCLKAPPVEFGLTEDTGGHITYILGAADAMIERPDIDRVEIATRLFDDPALPGPYAEPRETVRPGLDIVRLPTSSPGYLSKEALAREVGEFGEALGAYIEGLERRPDVIHAHFADAGGVAVAMRDRFGIPVVFTAHSLGIDKRDTLDAPCAALERRIAEEDRIVGLADAVIASSDDEIERQLMRYPAADAERVAKVPPGVTPPAPGPSDPDLLTPFLRDPSKPAILAIARPVHKKNLLGLVEMYGRSPALRERANLVIVAGLRDAIDCGEAEQRAVMRGIVEAIDAHDLYGQVAYPKRHSQGDVAALYARTAAGRGVFVNPAFTEPFGLTLLEAASFGLPVVATRHGGPADIVTGIGHGALADPADMATFERAILSYLTCADRWRAASRNARRGIDAYSWRGYARRCRAVYAGLGRPRAAPPAFHAPARAPRALLACDIDGTLTGDAAAARAFDRRVARMDGTVFAVATGRHLDPALRIMSAWGIAAPDILVTAVGTEIYWRQADGRLSLDEDFGRSMCDAWRPDGIDAHLAGIDGLKPQPPACQGPFKRSYFVASAATVRVARAALERAGLRAHLIHSHGDLLDVVPEGAGKGAALDWCARALGVAPDRTVAAGDSGNDADMLARAGRAIVVGNGDRDIRAAIPRGRAHFTRAAHAGGVLEGLARLGLEGRA